MNSTFPLVHELIMQWHTAVQETIEQPSDQLFFITLDL